MGEKKEKNTPCRHPLHDKWTQLTLIQFARVDKSTLKEPPNWNEPPHDKTNKMACAPSKDSDQPGHPPRQKDSQRPKASSCGQRSFWSDCVYLILCWVHSHFVGFVMRRLKCLTRKEWQCYDSIHRYTEPKHLQLPICLFTSPNSSIGGSSRRRDQYTSR